MVKKDLNTTDQLLLYSRAVYIIIIIIISTGPRKRSFYSSRTRYPPPHTHTHTTTMRAVVSPLLLLALLGLLGLLTCLATGQRLVECNDVLADTACDDLTHCVWDTACTPSCRWLMCEKIAQIGCKTSDTDDYCEWDTKEDLCCRTGEIGCHDPNFDVCEQDMYSFFGTIPCADHGTNQGACEGDNNCFWRPAICGTPGCVSRDCESHVQGQAACENNPMCEWVNDDHCVQATDRPPMCSGYATPLRCDAAPGCTWDGHYCVDSSDPACGTVDAEPACTDTLGCAWKNGQCSLDCAGLDETRCAAHISRCRLERSASDGTYGVHPDATTVCRGIYHTPDCHTVDHHACERYDTCRLDGTECVNVRACHVDKPWHEDSISSWLAGPDFFDDCRPVVSTPDCQISRGCQHQTSVCGRCTAWPCEAYALKHNCEARNDLCTWTPPGVCKHSTSGHDVVCTLVPTQTACDGEFHARCHWEDNRCVFGAAGCGAHTSDSACAATPGCRWIGSGLGCVPLHACASLPENICKNTFGCRWAGDNTCHLTFHPAPTTPRDVFDPHECKAHSENTECNNDPECQYVNGVCVGITSCATELFSDTCAARSECEWDGSVGRCVSRWGCFLDTIHGTNTRQTGLAGKQCDVQNNPPDWCVFAATCSAHHSPEVCEKITDMAVCADAPHCRVAGDAACVPAVGRNVMCRLFTEAVACVAAGQCAWNSGRCIATELGSCPATFQECLGSSMCAWDEESCVPLDRCVGTTENNCNTWPGCRWRSADPAGCVDVLVEGGLCQHGNPNSDECDARPGCEWTNGICRGSYVCHADAAWPLSEHMLSPPPGGNDGGGAPVDDDGDDDGGGAPVDDDGDDDPAPAAPDDGGNDGGGAPADDDDDDAPVDDDGDDDAPANAAPGSQVLAADTTASGGGGMPGWQVAVAVVGSVTAAVAAGGLIYWAVFRAPSPPSSIHQLGFPEHDHPDESAVLLDVTNDVSASAADRIAARSRVLSGRPIWAAAPR